MKSERCAWEVNTALADSKRVLPIVAKAVPDSEIPEQLRRLQFIRFDTGPGITRPLGQLADALRQDLDWIREHTRIGEFAGRWDARGRPDSGIEKQSLVVEDEPGTKRIRICEQSEQAQREPHEQVASIVARNTC